MPRRKQQEPRRSAGAIDLLVAPWQSAALMFLFAPVDGTSSCRKSERRPQPPPPITSVLGVCDAKQDRAALTGGCLRAFPPHLSPGSTSRASKAELGDDSTLGGTPFLPSCIRATVDQTQRWLVQSLA
ncbi:hypothetical protein AGIG_G22093 [Arapaima gigas]